MGLRCCGATPSLQSVNTRGRERVAAYLKLGRRALIGGGHRTSVEDKSDNETVETQDFGENEDKNHSDEETRLLSESTDTGITDNSNGETGSETGKTDRQTSTELNKAGEEGHGRLEATSDQDRHNETVLRVSSTRTLLISQWQEYQP